MAAPECKRAFNGTLTAQRRVRFGPGWPARAFLCKLAAMMGREFAN